jgi:hypothetical protein
MVIVIGKGSNLDRYKITKNRKVPLFFCAVSGCIIILYRESNVPKTK